MPDAKWREYAQIEEGSEEGSEGGKGRR